jgi:uncharacterized membrane protein YcaP (DUF421 family)
MEKVFFDTWESLLRTVILTILGYISIVIMLRASGKRTLSKMNAFDFIITIALGSTLASVAVSRNVSLADGATAMGLFIALQYIITRLSIRFKSFYRLVTARPTLLMYKGDILKENLRKERITGSPKRSFTLVSVITM